MNKNIIRVSALALVIVMLAAALASCGGPSGTYEASVLGQSLSYTFKGSKVTIKLTVLGQVVSIDGTYKISRDEITFTFEGDDENAKKYSGTQTFEQGDDYVKIGGVQYTKKK